jgi:hypothetical protein
VINSCELDPVVRLPIAASELHNAPTGGLKSSTPAQRSRECPNSVSARKNKHFCEFGPSALTPRSGSFFVETSQCPLTPKAFETLLILVRSSERVVLKEDLMKTLWPDSFVEEAGSQPRLPFCRESAAGHGRGRRPSRPEPLHPNGNHRREAKDPSRISLGGSCSLGGGVRNRVPVLSAATTAVCHGGSPGSPPFHRRSRLSQFDRTGRRRLAVHLGLAIDC